MRDYSVISGKTLTIRRTNPRTPVFIYIVAVFLVGFPVMYFVAPGMQNLPWFFMVIVLVFTVLNLRAWGLLTTITIGPEGVSYKSLLTERLYEWHKIKTAGMFVQHGLAVHVLERQNFNETFFIRLKYVWFSLDTVSHPKILMFPGENYCNFEFRKEAWELFNQYLVGNPDPNKLQEFSVPKTYGSERRGF